MSPQRQGHVGNENLYFNFAVFPRTLPQDELENSIKDLAWWTGTKGKQFANIPTTRRRGSRILVKQVGGTE